MKLVSVGNFQTSVRLCLTIYTLHDVPLRAGLPAATHQKVGKK